MSSKKLWKSYPTPPIKPTKPIKPINKLRHAINHPLLAVRQFSKSLCCFVQSRNLRLAGSNDIVAWLGGDVDAGVPVDGHVLDELEGIHVGLVVFWEVGGHLQWRVEGYVQT